MAKHIKKRCLSQIFVQFFLSLKVPKDFVANRLFFSVNLSIEIIYAEGGIKISPKTLCITRGERAGVTFPTEKLLSHSTENHRLGALVCFKKFLVSKKFLRGEDIKIFNQGLA